MGSRIQNLRRSSVFPSGITKSWMQRSGARQRSDYEAVPRASRRVFAVNASQSSRNQEQGAISEPSEHRSKYDGWTVCPLFLPGFVKRKLFKGRAGRGASLRGEGRRGKKGGNVGHAAPSKTACSPRSGVIG